MRLRYSPLCLLRSVGTRNLHRADWYSRCAAPASGARPQRLPRRGITGALTSAGLDRYVERTLAKSRNHRNPWPGARERIWEGRQVRSEMIPGTAALPATSTAM
jgi:hypothetical protein